MKYLPQFLFSAFAGIVLGCTTAQLQQTRTVADPLVAAAVRGYAAEHGVPPALVALGAKP